MTAASNFSHSTLARKCLLRFPIIDTRILSPVFVSNLVTECSIGKVRKHRVCWFVRKLLLISGSGNASWMHSVCLFFFHDDYDG